MFFPSGSSVELAPGSRRKTILNLSIEIGGLLRKSFEFLVGLFLVLDNASASVPKTFDRRQHAFDSRVIDGAFVVDYAEFSSCDFSLEGLDLLLGLFKLEGEGGISLLVGSIGLGLAMIPFELGTAE